MKNNKEINKGSKFWAGDYLQDYLNGAVMNGGKNSSTEEDLMLARLLRQARGFVSILVPERNIDVRFADREGGCYTDGHTITISADFKNFDTTIGVMLHEASHIKWNSFGYEKTPFEICESMIKKWKRKEVRNWVLAGQNIRSHMYHSIINTVEDMRIDFLMQCYAPGYRVYYQALYEETYFKSKEWAEALVDPKREEITLGNYDFQIIGMRHPKHNPDCLPEMRKIKQMAMSRYRQLENHTDTIQLCMDMLEIIEGVLYDRKEEIKEEMEQEQKKSNGSGQGGNGKGEKQEKEEGKEKNEEKEEGDDTDEEKKDEEVEDEDGNGGDDDGNEEKEDEDGDGGDAGNGEGKPGDQSSGSGNGKTSDEIETEATEKVVGKAPEEGLTAGDIAKIIEIINHGMPKKALPASADINEIEKIAGGKTEIREVNKGRDKVIVSTVQCEAVQNGGGSGGDLSFIQHHKSYYERFRSSVDEGLMYGKKLARKLQTRNEARDTIYGGMKTGKLDKRKVATIGFSDTCFYRKDTSEYAPLYLHMSIDASGSMDGNKWVETVKLLTCVVSAVNQLKKSHVCISYRYEENGNNHLALKVYDSRIHSFTEFKKNISCFQPGGGTPEGLCYEGIKGDIISEARGKDAYFINLSDGQPGYSNGANHTKQQVDEIRKAGIKVLAFFISNRDGGTDWDVFRSMYGKDSVSLAAENVHLIAKELNKRFLER